MVDSFTWQNVSVPKGPSSVAKKGGYKTNHVFVCPFLPMYPIYRRGNDSLLYHYKNDLFIIHWFLLEGL